MTCKYLRSYLRVCVCVIMVKDSQWRNQLHRIFGSELIQINSIMKTARSFCCFAASTAKCWNRGISSALEKVFPGFRAIFLVAQHSPKKRFFLTRIHSLLVNGYVTASSHALWRILSNKVIWVLGHCWVDTPHIHTFEGDSVLSKLFAPYCHGHAEWPKLCQQKGCF